MKKSIVSLIAVALLSACNSPLIDHAQAQETKKDKKDQAAQPQQERPQAEPTAQPSQAAPQVQKTCPLAFPKHGLCASLEWEGVPNDQDPASFRLRFWSAETGSEAGPYLDPGLTVAAKLWMPVMGHGSSPVQVEKLKDSSGGAITGVYRATGAYFIMPGDWDIHVQLKKENAVNEEATLSVHI